MDSIAENGERLVMWGTYVMDAYRWDERKEVRDALEGIASARDRYGFASGGVYFFWDWTSREVLYVGRAIDLAERFRAHNGMAGKKRGTKRARIESYFERGERLGFTILVRSPNEQTSVARFKKQLRADFGEIEGMLEHPYVRSKTELEIAHAEGAAIRSCFFEFGRLPRWNAINGTVSESGAAMNSADSTPKVVVGATDSLLQSRATIRELDQNPTFLQFESILLAARIVAIDRALKLGVMFADHDVLLAFDRLANDSVVPDWVGFSQERERIREDRYLLRRPFTLAAVSAPGSYALRERWTVGSDLGFVPPSPPG